ncbi:MAG: heparinase II/III family protein [Clostridia bacterium]|nr:heparinase II/III family protein [Clostridia bacterium]
MFQEFISAHPLSSLIASPAPFPLYPPAGSAPWRGLKDSVINQITTEAEKFSALPYPMRLATDFLAFTRTGSRKADEDPYFFRRRKLCWAALRCCVDENASLDDVIDGLWCISEETTWVISAHNVNPIPGAPSPAEYPLPDPDRPYIDLFSAQTGMILSIVSSLLRNRLEAAAPQVLSRVQRELRLRVLTPFMENDDFWWMGFRRKDLCNWTPWIVSNILVTACLTPLPESAPLPSLMERALLMVDRWLDTVPADGGCDEGAGYWNMAGGALLDCVEVLEKAAGNMSELWRDPKLRAIASFPLKMEIGHGWFANFADCDARPFLSGERLQYAGLRLGDGELIALGHRHRGTVADQMKDVPHLTRLLSFLFTPDPEGVPSRPGDVWLKDLQVRLVRRGRLALCCKGGHNGESHNHNDVGSFMLYADSEPVILDAGNMTYTAKTFSDERYSLWNVRSAWHNLPLPLGKEQLPGRDRRAEDVLCLPDGLALELRSAYGCGDILSVRRELRLRDDSLVLRDRIETSKSGETAWVFMLRFRPSVIGSTVESGPVRISFPEGFSFACEEIPVGDPRMAANFPGSLFRILLTAPESQAVDALFTVRTVS